LGVIIQKYLVLKEDRKMKSMAKVFMVLALVAVICLPGMALANPLVDLAQTGVTNYVLANIWADGLNQVNNVETGNYILSIRNPAGSGNPYFDYVGYCIEPRYSSSSPLLYELLPIAENTVYEAAAWILSKGYTALAPAAQAAVWELTWDKAVGNGYDLGAGNFRLLSAPPAAADVASIYNLAVAQMGIGGFDPSPYVIAHNPANTPFGPDNWQQAQDFIIKNPVPLPPSALLLGTGLLGLVGLRWRRKQTS
jgi:hypothetical protein